MLHFSSCLAPVCTLWKDAILTCLSHLQKWMKDIVSSIAAGDVREENVPNCWYYTIIAQVFSMRETTMYLSHPIKPSFYPLPVFEIAFVHVPLIENNNKAPFNQHYSSRYNPNIMDIFTSNKTVFFTCIKKVILSLKFDTFITPSIASRPWRA